MSCPLTNRNTNLESVNMVCLFCCILPGGADQRKVKIDPLSIGPPTGFRHVAHMGSDIQRESTMTLTDEFEEYDFPVHLKLVDLPVSAERKSSSPSGDSHMTSLAEPPVDQVFFPNNTDTSSSLQPESREPPVLACRPVTTPNAFETGSTTPDYSLPPSSQRCPSAPARPDRNSGFQTRSINPNFSPLPPPPPPPTYRQYLRVSSS
ncbi:hypothetical protein CRM22_010528 [Opisthorchis felineus]|uniref:CRIB domain-containing protein n=1 Tax=Opisthorchis felineus TaxID=147828 RepID=A0A4V3SBZ9_OPIFE|nr:hypothetical protein CRM22_010528 [Opisthorchis felineus]